MSISKMFEKGLNVAEVASISGHKTASQLFRYIQVNGRLLAWMQNTINVIKLKPYQP